MPKKPRPFPVSVNTVAATLHEARDICALTAAGGIYATLAPTEAVDVASITGTIKTAAQIAATDSADICAISGTVLFKATAQLPILEARDNPNVGVSPLNTVATNTLRQLPAYPNPDPAFQQAPGPPGGLQVLNTSNITDYSGMCYDPIGKQILQFGGGDGVGQNNDIRAFNLQTLTWASLYRPNYIPSMNNQANHDAVYGRWLDTNAAEQRHSYNMLQVVGRRFYMMCWRGMADHLSWGGGVSTWGGRMAWYDLNQPVAYNPPAFNAWQYSTIPQGSTPWDFDVASCLDPISQKILVVGDARGAGVGQIYVYDPVADSVLSTGVSLSPYSVYSNDLVYCPDNDKFYMFLFSGTCYVWEITFNRATPSASTFVGPLTMTGTPPTGAASANCGFAWDTVNHIIGGQPSGGFFYGFDPIGRVWTRKAMQLEAGSSGPTDLVYHCLDFDPDSGCFIYLSYDAANYAASLQSPTWAYCWNRPSSSSVNDMVVTLDFGGGSIGTFSGGSAVDKGDFVGEFVRQKCYLATDPAFPDWRVWIRPDGNSAGNRIVEPAIGWRDEIIVEYGRSTSGTPTHHLSAFVATVKKSGATVYSATIPRQLWYSRWRYQSAVRPVVRTPAVLKSRGWIPNFNTAGMYGGGADSVNQAWTGPMTNPPQVSTVQNSTFNPYMNVGGDHDEIGYLTEQAASYMIFGAAQNLTTLRTQGEWTGNWCMHIRDDSTNAPVAVRNLTTFFKDQSGGTINNAPADPGTTPSSFVNVEAAHWYANANGPWLLTDDPFFLEALQFGCTWRILWDYSPRLSLGIPGLMPPTELRAYAWGIRDLFLVTASTPAVVPSWLQSKAYWQGCLDDNKTFANLGVNAPARLYTVFRVWGGGGIVAWMNAWVSACIGLGIRAGFSDWQTVFDWSIGMQIALSNGTSGWNKQWPVPYIVLVNTNSAAAFSQYYPFSTTAPDATTPASWTDLFTSYSTGGAASDNSNHYADVTVTLPSGLLAGHTLTTGGWDGHSLMAPFYNTAADQYNPNLPTGWTGTYAGYFPYFLHFRSALALASTIGTTGASACYSYIQGELATTMPNVYNSTGQCRFSIDP